MKNPNNIFLSLYFCCDLGSVSTYIRENLKRENTGTRNQTLLAD